MHLRELVDERPAASVSRIMEAERDVKAAEEALKEEEAKVVVKNAKKTKGVKKT